MNKKINILLFVLSGFILNIFFYIFSDNYRYFLQSLKKEKTINDQFTINLNNIVKEEEQKKQEDSLFAGLKKDFNEEGTINKKVDKKNIKKEYIEKVNFQKVKKQKTVIFTNKKEEIKLTNIEKNILDKLKKYKLKKVEIHPRLFDLTNEYPDKYFEYYNKNLTIYFFGNKTYDDLKDIFEVLTYELPFSINEVNNFGKKSFYINLNPLFDDNYIRIILKTKSRTFGIKVKKDLYTKIKNDLGIIFKN